MKQTTKIKKIPIEALSKQPHFIRSIIIGIILAIILSVLVVIANILIGIIIGVVLIALIWFSQNGIKNNEGNTMYQIFIISVLSIMGVIAGLVLLFIMNGRKTVFNWTLPIVILYLLVWFLIGGHLV